MERAANSELYFSNAESLGRSLAQAGIPLELWGIGAAKTIQHLFDEIECGESRLSRDQNGEIVRKVSAVWVNVFAQDAHRGRYWRLREDRQVFNDGRERRRQLSGSLGEKIKPGEEPLEAAERALREELGVTQAERIVYVEEEWAARSSSSYPGLETRYVTHHVLAELAESSFRPEGYQEMQPDKTTYFVWELA